MPKLVSGKVKLAPPDQLSNTRYQFIDLRSTEPNLGSAPANGYVLIYNPEMEGNRAWSDILFTIYNAANAAANTVKVSQNSGSTINAASGLNFVNSRYIAAEVSQAPDGNANVSFTVDLAIAGGTLNIYENQVLNIANSFGINFNNTETINLSIDAIHPPDSPLSTTANLNFTVNTDIFVLKVGDTIRGSLNVDNNLAANFLFANNISNTDNITISSNDYIWTFDTTGNLTTSGTITVNGAYSLPTYDGIANQVMVADGTGNVIWSSNLTLYDVNVSNVLSGNVQTSNISNSANIQITSNGYVFTFDTEGNFSTPNTVITSHISAPSEFYNNAQTSITITSDGQGWTFDGANTSLFGVATLSFPNGATIGDLDQQNGIELYASNTISYSALNAGYDQYFWVDINAAYVGTNYFANGQYQPSGGDYRIWTFDKQGNVTLPPVGSTIIGGYDRVTIKSYVDGNNWTFDYAGILTTPGTINVNSAYTLPTYDGLANQVYLTDGAGTITWSSLANDAYNLANTANNTANSAYYQANVSANTVRVSQNSDNTINAAAGINFVNTASINVSVTQGESGNANVSFTVDLTSVEQLIFTETLSGANIVETLTGFQNTVGHISPVRTVAITNGVLSINLAAFTPKVSATISPPNPYWDQGITSFTAYASNPTDYTSEYLSNVYSITQETGNVTGTINDFVAQSFNVTPTGGSSWQRTYNTNGFTGFIGSTTDTVSGGSASANLSYNVHATTDSDSEYLGANAVITVTWQSAAPTISITSLESNTFLNSYSSTTYTVGSTGIANTPNVVQTITPTGGTVSNPSGSGTITFDTLVSVANGVSSGISVSTEAQFSRPANVTGTSYTANASASASLSNPTWTYPTFSMFTVNRSTFPVRANVISGSSFSGNGDTLNILGNSVKNFTGNVTNSGINPKGWWLGVASNALQPSSFKAGTATLQTPVTPVIGSVILYPDANSTISQTYSLYGFTVQSGNTYFTIS
jgi:hypothetical protein